VIRTARKVSNTERQSRLGGVAARRANILNAFRPWRPERWAGKRLLLIDDVLTTGATVSELSRELLVYGAASVCCGFLAVTPKS
jgi:predicted amidophosphoribosyltransferase